MPLVDTAALPFLKLPGASLASTNAVDFGSVVGTFLPIKVHTWDHPVQDKPFLNHSGCVRLGDLTLLSTCGSAIEGEVEQRADAQLVLPYQASINTYEIGRHHFRFRRSALFIPAAGTRIRIHTNITSGVVFSFSSDTLLPVAHAIAGPGFDGLALRSALEQPSVLDRRSDPRRDRCQRLLMEALAFAEQSMAIAGELNPILRLDDLIRRLLVMLLVPDLLEPLEPAAVGEQAPFVHASLVEWVLAHLDAPISLSDLEQRSHYSRRSLQHAFKERFGCGPMQWLRRQRLAKARSLLMQPGSHILSEVALSCGYLTVASFSRDYTARYGEPPSVFRRRIGMGT